MIHDPALASCATGQVVTIQNNQSLLALEYDQCNTGEVTWDGRISMTPDINQCLYDIEFGTTNNSLVNSQSEPTLRFPYLDFYMAISLKGSMRVFIHLNYFPGINFLKRTLCPLSLIIVI